MREPKWAKHTSRFPTKEWQNRIIVDTLTCFV